MLHDMTFKNTKIAMDRSSIICSLGLNDDNGDVRIPTLIREPIVDY
jgi:hypothetical protein